MITISHNTVYSVLEGRVKASLAADIPKKTSQQQLKKTRMKKKILADDDYAYLYLSLTTGQQRFLSPRDAHNNSLNSTQQSAISCGTSEITSQWIRRCSV